MSKTMKAAQVIEVKKRAYEIRDVPIPEPGSREIRIKTAAAGFCHTDLDVLDGGFTSWPNGSLPITGSHEPVGIVDAIGPNVEGYAVGDRIGAVSFMHPCRKCPDCHEGHYHFCPALGGIMGLNKPGAFSEYSIIDATFATKIPSNISFEMAAPLMCAGATIFGVIKACKLKKGDSLGMIGVGGLGSLGVQFAKCLGLKVVAIDVREEPLDLVRSFKHAPDVILNPKVDKEPSEFLPKVVEKIGKSNGYDGLDAVIVATEAKSAFHYAAQILHIHGLMMCVGLGGMIEVKDMDLIFKDIHVQGGVLPGAEYLQEMLDLVNEFGIESHLNVYEFEKINQMVTDFQKPESKGKYVIKF